jgi:hypothetical protein
MSHRNVKMKNSKTILVHEYSCINFLRYYSFNLINYYIFRIHEEIEIRIVKKNINLNYTFITFHKFIKIF